MNLAIVTATVDRERARSCIDSWFETGSADLRALYLIDQDQASPYTHDGWATWPRHDDRKGRGHTQLSTYVTHGQILGVVPAFALGVARALEDGADVIACLHDDLEINENGWDQDVREAFENPRVGLVGFGGARGLGSDDIYRTPYNPMQLARQDFVSNMRHAEAHGRRGLVPERVACLDGFSQIGRREFWEGYSYARALADFGGVDGSGTNPVYIKGNLSEQEWEQNLFERMEALGMVHHAYDACLGAFAARLGWEVWMLPVACHHFGGRTAVADNRYTDWARERFAVTDWKGQHVEGDAACWTEAHRITYDQFRDVLPIRV